jgi:hypothetical protein
MLAVIMILGAGISALIASGKNRNPIGWAVLGLCFPLIGIIVVACQASLPPPAPPSGELPPSRTA